MAVTSGTILTGSQLSSAEEKFLGIADRAKLATYLDPVQKARFITERTMLRMLVAQLEQTKPEFITVKEKKHPKYPRYISSSGRTHAAITSVGDQIFAAASLKGVVGISALDIVEVAQSPAEIVYEILNGNEIPELVKQNDPPLAFAHWWAKKLAILNALGHPNATEREITVKNPYEIGQTSQVQVFDRTIKGLWVEEVNVGAGIVAAVSVLT